jgi:hypothetical protein
MKIILKTIRLTKVDIQFVKNKNNENIRVKMEIEREKFAGEKTGDENMVSAIKYSSHYVFTLNSKKNYVSFDSIFEIVGGVSKKDLSKIAESNIDNFAEALLWSHEVSILKGILENFGANLSSGLPLGIEFNV